MNTFRFSVSACDRVSARRTEPRVFSVCDKLTIEKMDRFNFQAGPDGSLFLKYNLKVQDGPWVYCQMDWPADGGAVTAKYLMEEAFGKVILKEGTSMENFISLMQKPFETPFEVILKKRRLWVPVGRDGKPTQDGPNTTWFVYVNQTSPTEEQVQRWMKRDIDYMQKEEWLIATPRTAEVIADESVTPTPKTSFEDATE